MRILIKIHQRMRNPQARKKFQNNGRCNHSTGKRTNFKNFIKNTISNMLKGYNKGSKKVNIKRKENIFIAK